MRALLARHSPLVILALLCIVLAVVSEDFRKPHNLRQVMYRTSVVGIIAAGQTLVIIGGGIDLSVGSVAALGGIFGCYAMRHFGVPVPLGILFGSMLGTLTGAVNGVLSTKGRIPPFIVTLGMMMVARGAALLISGGVRIFGLPEAFRLLGGARGWWIPVAVTVGIAAVLSVTLTFARYGRALYATGGNARAARLSGVPVDRVRTIAFAVCGTLSAFGGVMLASRTGVAEPTAAEGMELDAIAACVIGGASLMGGEGGVIGALAGALIMNVLVNFCNLQDFDVYWQKVLVGVLIVALVYYDTVRRRRAGLLRE